MATPEEMETLKKEVRSVLLSQTDGKGIPQNKFIKHYRDLLMKPLNYRVLGHKNLVELLETMPDVARIEYHPKTNDAYFFGVLDKTSYVGIGARKASVVKKFSTNDKENQKREQINSNDKKVVKKFSTNDKENQKREQINSNDKKVVKKFSTNDKENQKREQINSNDKKGLKSMGSSDRKDVRSKGSYNKGRSKGCGGWGDQTAQNTSSKNNMDMKGGLHPNMKGMWAICLPKENMGGKSREDLVDVFAEAGEVAECGMSQRYVFIRYWSKENASQAIDLFGQEYGVLIPSEKSGTRQFNDHKNRRNPDQTDGDHGHGDRDQGHDVGHQGHGDQGHDDRRLGHEDQEHDDRRRGHGDHQKFDSIPSSSHEDKTPEKVKNVDLLSGYYGEGTGKTPPRDRNNNKQKRHSAERDKSRNSSGSTSSSGLDNLRTLFIGFGNLRDSITKEDIDATLEKYPLERIRFISSNKGFGFVKFKTREAAAQCMMDRELYRPLRFEWAKEETSSKPEVRVFAGGDIRDADFDAERAKERAKHLELVAMNNQKQETVKDGDKQEEPTVTNRQVETKIGNRGEENKEERRQKSENQQAGQKFKNTGRQYDHKFKNKQGGNNTRLGQSVNTQKNSLHSKNFQGDSHLRMNGDVDNDDMPELDDSDEMPELEEGMPELEEGMPELEEGMPKLANDFDNGLNSLSDSFSLASNGIERGGVSVYVSHFPWQTTVEILMGLFRPYQAMSVSIMRHPSVTQAFVKISSAISAERAVRDLNNSIFYGQTLHVDISRNEVETFAALLQEEKESLSKTACVRSGMSVLSGGHNLSLPKAMQYESMMEMAVTCGNPFYIEGFLQKRFDILITSVVDKTHFWGHIQYMVDDLRSFQKVREGLQKIPFKTPVAPTISRGMVWNEKEWYRVWIMEDLPSDFARILCIDYGREDVVKRSDICQVPDLFWKVLPMAAPFCMRSGQIPVQNDVVSATFLMKKNYVLHVDVNLG